MDIQKRHAGHHHTINVKYGYIIFGVSLLYAVLFILSKQIFIRQWGSQNRPNTKSVWHKYTNSPTWIHVTIWTIIYLGLTFFNVKELGENYAVVIKRVGRLAYALVPLDILLVIRPALLGGSYLEYISLHKWILRLILLFSVAHGVGFFVKWLVQGAFWSKTLKWANFLGVVVAGVSVVLAAISIRPIRQKVYAAFYVVHNITVFTFLVLITFHARPGIGDFAILILAMLLFQAYQRAKVYAAPKISIIDIDSSLLRILRISKPENYGLWLPGSHIRLGYPRTNFRFWLFPAHPYTLTSLPEDSSLDLVVKKGFRFQVFSSLDYTISSPFEALPAPFFSSAETVSILCGGSGISLGIPIYRYLKQNSTRVSLFWCVSNKNDVYILNEFNLTSRIDVYVTGSQDTLFVSETENEDNGLLHEQFELETLNSEDPFGDNHEIPFKSEIVFHTGRPNLDEILSSFSETHNQDNKWAIACGPQSLVDDVRKYSKENDVQLFTELYDM